MHTSGLKPSWTAPQPRAHDVSGAIGIRHGLSRTKILLITAILLASLLIVKASISAQAPAVPPHTSVSAIVHQTFAGPAGKVTLLDWPEGPRWLTWFKANRSWAGQPLWADRPWHEYADCSAFVNAIVCLNLDAKAHGTKWALLPALLGTMAMLRADLQPTSGDQPAGIVAHYMVQQQAKGVDTYYRYGIIQSPPITLGALTVEYYQRARFAWPTGDTNPADLRPAPLGQLANSGNW
jgi:hypothetical protein